MCPTVHEHLAFALTRRVTVHMRCMVKHTEETGNTSAQWMKLSGLHRILKGMVTGEVGVELEWLTVRRIMLQHWLKTQSKLQTLSLRVSTKPEPGTTSSLQKGTPKTM